MSVIANFAVPSDAFPLGPALSVDPDARITLESMVPMVDSLMPYFWCSSTHAERIEEALANDGTVEQVVIVDQIGEQTLFRVEWGEINGFVGSILETEAVVMDATGTGEEWTFQLRFPDSDALSAFYLRCVEHDVAVDLNRIHNPVGSEQHTQFGLTPEQREVLVAAMEHGYFAVPRETTLVELGELLDISDSAVSQRLRRGLSALISTTLLSSPSFFPPETD